MQRKEIYLRELDRIRQQVNRLFEQTLLGAGYEAGAEAPPGMWGPPVDVVEDDSAFFLYAELPGVAGDDIQVEVAEQNVEISGSRRPVAEGRHFLRMESSYGPFRRTIVLDREILAEGLDTSFDDGVLRITLPKR